MRASPAVIDHQTISLSQRGSGFSSSREPILNPVNFILTSLNTPFGRTSHAHLRNGDTTMMTSE
jgi:hypothetical protein